MSLIHVLASTNMDPRQDPHLRTHVSASLCLRLLCKIHVSGSMSQHPCVSQGPLQDPCLRIHQISAAICISGSSTWPTSSDSRLSIFVSHGFKRSKSPDPCLSIFMSQDPLQDPCLRIHESASICISRSSARSMSPGSCLSIFASQDPLQDPCLQIHVSASSYLRVLCKIHVSDSCLSNHLYLRILCRIHVSRLMSQHLCISGSSARSMSPDPWISIHMYLRIPCKIHVSDSCLSIFISPGPLQDPCLRIHVSASLCLRILCKTHVSGSMNQHPYVSQDPLQDPCLQAHVSASLHLRILYKIHVFGFMSQHLLISGSSAKIHVCMS